MNIKKCSVGNYITRADLELTEMRIHARALMQEYNLTSYDRHHREQLLQKMLGKTGNNIDIQAPFFIDYGFHIEVSNNFFANFNCVFLDGCISNCHWLGTPATESRRGRCPPTTAYNTNDNLKGTLLDCNYIKMGDNVFLGPVQIYTAHHPVIAEERIKGPELATAITIGDNVWIGDGSIICAGVTIGANTTIGAGSVVVKDIPAGVITVGNPCKVMRTL